MIDPGLVAGQVVTPSGLDDVKTPPQNGAEPLELRVDRLEAAVANLQDTKQLEERVSERVAKRLKRNLGSSNADSGIVDSSKRPIGPSVPVATLYADGYSGTAPAGPRTGWLGWILFAELIYEARLIVRLYFDRCYRPTWLGRIAPPVILIMILLSYLWIPFSSIMPWFIERPVEKGVDLLLAFILIKILVREVSRYRVFLVEHPAPPR